MTRQIPVFFYGSFMSVDVLTAAKVRPQRPRPARLLGWSLHIGGFATLVPADQGAVFGLVADCSHADLDRLYSPDWVSAYVAEPVLVDIDGAFSPAITYVLWDPPAGRPKPEYVDNIAGPAEALGFPEWYLAHIRSFI